MRICIRTIGETDELPVSALRFIFSQGKIKFRTFAAPFRKAPLAAGYRDQTQDKKTSRMNELNRWDDLLAEVATHEDPFVNEVLRDYYIACLSREASLISRKEVLTGKAKFGISGDGKEVPQIALARAFRKGDYRAGYYRDQTILFALGLCTLEDYFAQLYADPANDPFSGGRQMSSHFATPFIDRDGNWLPLRDLHNISADISPTGGQMARALGLALASRKFRELGDQVCGEGLSDEGREVVFCTIGDASTSEGIFFETVNAAAVQQVPLVIAVWDDGYGISVPKSLQTAKESISKILEGFLPDEDHKGLQIYTVRGWDYPALCETFEKAAEKAREHHIPVLVHVQEVTQPQGHSTSGSHERYKSRERLEWEAEYDCLRRMGEWMEESGLATSAQLEEIRDKARAYARECRQRAWAAFSEAPARALAELKEIYAEIGDSDAEVAALLAELGTLINPVVSEVFRNGRQLLYHLLPQGHPAAGRLSEWLNSRRAYYRDVYNERLYADGDRSALQVPVVPAAYSEESQVVNGYQVLNHFFEQIFADRPEIIAFGEDVGKIGDVNQGFSGLQEKYGDGRIFDAGIREWTIAGQAIGLAMRGFRPIAEIQYLDYLVYALSALTDDLATLRYRSNGQQKAPVIIRTRGHRLEGIWHAGSPISMILGSLRGMYVCTPRNMTQAAGMYNTLLQSDDPAIVIECLNGYRLKEQLPDNLGEYTLPLGVPEVLHEGSDVTLVTYGSCVRIAEEALLMLSRCGISAELIDVQTLLPFDLEHRIADSLRKTGRLVILDEDVPGGATAYMMQQILEVQKGYRYLDSDPRTISAQPHRPPYGSDGDYFSKPNPEDVFETVYGLMREADPQAFPARF